MKRLFGLLTVVLMLSLTSCNYDENNSNTVLNSKQEDLMQEANRQVGMPAIKNFQERKLMKLILEERDKVNLICYAYIIPEMTGKPVFLGKCMGYGLPYSTQYTNPEKVSYANDTKQISDQVLPQADPNGLFMPASAEGTWLFMIDPATNDPKPVYCESRVLVSPFKLSE